MKYTLISCFIIIFCSAFHSRLTDTHKLTMTATISGRDENSIAIKVTLTNTTPDTIKYVTWNCSWQDSYSIDNDRWCINANFCYTNGQETISIPPYKSETRTLELKKVVGYTKSKTSNFKIGFHFVPAPDHLKSTTIKLEKLASTAVTVWSNKVTVNYFSQH